MAHCLILGILSTQRLISNEVNLNDVEATPHTIYVKSLLSCSNNQPYSIALIDSMSMYFDRIRNHVKLLCTRDLLSYGQLSYDTRLTSIQSNNTLPLTVNLSSFIYLPDLFPSSQHLSNLYDLCDEYFLRWFDKDDLMVLLISYNLCKSDILLGQKQQKNIINYIYTFN
ncbi:unnamed protein product [Rotaria sp. Silwood2]|nr:unnamed protein product [Rotaria sp. Silwood2]CAF4482591.1 unnamed protein product [Rotaria sp. Silwood2]